MPDPDADLGPALAPTQRSLSRAIARCMATRRAERAVGVVGVGDGRAPERHDRVADELVERAAVLEDDLHHLRRDDVRARLGAGGDADGAVDGEGGTPRGFMAGAAINIVGCVVGALALQWRSFPLFCVATGIIGVYNAVGLQYRFAAAEVAAPEHRAKAISLVLAGGVVGGLIGPQATRFTRDLFATPFQGSFVMLAAFALVALAVQSRVHVPPPSLDERAGTGRPLAQSCASRRSSSPSWPARSATG